LLLAQRARSVRRHSGLNIRIRLNVKFNKTLKSPEPAPARLEPRTVETSADRRRVGRIVRDERGNGVLEWVDVTEKQGFDHEPLSLQDSPLSIQQEAESFNPYERRPTSKPANGERPVKRDLRKLSEWIKTMRAVEEKKIRGED